MQLDIVSAQEFNELKTQIGTLAQAVQQVLKQQNQPQPDDHAEPTTPTMPAPTAADAPPTMPSTPGTNTPPVNMQAFTELQNQLTTAVARIQQLERDNQQLHLDRARAAQQRELDRVTNFVELMASDAHRKIAPGDKATKVQLLMAMSSAEQDFNDPTTGSTIKKSPRSVMMEQIQNGPSLWSTGKMPIGPEFDDYSDVENTLRIEIEEVDRNSIDLDRKVRQFMKQEGLSDYIEAYDRYTTVTGITE